MTLYNELKKRIEEDYNSNFHNLGMAERAHIMELCELIDEKEALVAANKEAENAPKKWLEASVDLNAPKCVPVEPKTCEWKAHADPSHYKTECCSRYYSKGDLRNTDFVFCPYCGGRIDEH